jgi:LPXTG-motif cell wall-anchored protein
MAYLQLADNSSTINRTALIDDNYVFIPTPEGGKYVREDYFDQFDDVTFIQIMEALEPYQNVGTAGIFKKWKERRAEKRDERKARRAAKQERKNLRVQSKADARRQRSQGGGFFGKALDTVKGIFGGQDEIIDAGVNFQTGQQPDAFFNARTRPESWIPGIPNAVTIIGGVVLIGGGIYLATRKKKK